MLDMLFVVFVDVEHAINGLCRCWTCCLWSLPMLNMLFKALPMLEMLFMAFADVEHAV
jgi:hypothetical protein